MNRGKTSYSGKVIKKLLNLPEDFEFSGTEYDHKHDIIEVYGYSKKFDSIPECSAPTSKIL